MDLGLQMRDRGMSLEDASKGKTPHNLTLKSIEKLVGEVLGNNKITKMFQAMAIVSMNMGDLGLEIQFLKIG
jgi:hypothetical protein